MAPPCDGFGDFEDLEFDNLGGVTEVEEVLGDIGITGFADALEGRGERALSFLDGGDIGGSRAAAQIGRASCRERVF